MDKERRRAPRFQFIAPAELIDQTSGARTMSWVADLGLRGCCVSTNEGPCAGSAIQLKIGSVPREQFNARATVVHLDPERMGIAFNEIDPGSLEILSRWLATAKFPKGRS
jgi:PilZ domain